MRRVDTRPLASTPPQRPAHARWVRLCHWLLAASVLALSVSGFVVLMAHPRLYWGEAGNDLTPALLELPISRNYRHGGWEQNVVFADGPSGPVVSASRTYEIFNENGWARSLHFLAAWALVATGAVYLLVGLVSGHARELMPRVRDLAPPALWRDLVARLRGPGASVLPGPPYGALQRCAYSGTLFLALPLLTVTGLAMSPAVTAAYPVIASVWGGSQSARTIHFFAFASVAVFAIGHVLMTARTGFGRQLRALTIGGPRGDATRRQHAETPAAKQLSDVI
ncbi:MAG TPA: cytochrome b/b6 domain-containing protein [Gammaproteobacteria bacterium]|nr:cytochrome b/b6 domain-containing protein [Gammaproteobacteria bacterium]